MPSCFHNFVPSLHVFYFVEHLICSLDLCIMLSRITVSITCVYVVLVAPSAPLNVEAVAITSSSITWIWDKPTNHDNKVTQFQVSRYWLWNTVNVMTGTYYKWTGLSANTQYRFRVRAVTGGGNYGRWSSWEYAYTLPPGT